MIYLKAAASAALILGAATAAVAEPRGRSVNQQGQAVQQLRSDVLVVMSAGDNPPGQSSRPTDPDMGDDNAALRAISEVCTKNTPAARRSAICDDQPVSPD